MSRDIGKSSEFTIERIPLATGTFVDFETERDGWNLYKIKDGSLLRARVVFSSFLMKDRLEDLIKQIKPGQKPKLGLGFRSRTIFAVESPPELRGKPDSKTYPIAKLKSSIIDEDMDFETMKEVWNLYKLENGITVKARLSVVAVNKTDKFDIGGVPIYTIDSNMDLKVDLPDHIRKIIDEKSESE